MNEKKLTTRWRELGRSSIALNCSGDYVKIRDYEGDFAWLPIPEAIELGKLAEAYQAEQEKEKKP